MKKSLATKTDMFSDKHHKQSLNRRGEPLTEIKSCFNFAALAAEVDCIPLRPAHFQGGRLRFSNETIVRNVVWKRLSNPLVAEQPNITLLVKHSPA